MESGLKKDSGRKVLLLGETGTKRTSFFMQAARKIGLPVFFVEWSRWRALWRGDFKDALLKIDPPVWDSCVLKELDGLAGGYKRQLEELASLQEEQGFAFLDHPLAIRELLDKRACKERLIREGLMVTEQVAVSEAEARELRAGSTEDPARDVVVDTDQLLERMAARRIFQVFIKPVHGSGAAGTAAFRWEPRTGRMMLYTCALLVDAAGLEKPSAIRLVNTKRLRCFSREEEIRPLLDRLLRLGCIVERWYAKAGYGGCSYDLRAVVQGGTIDFLLARLSKGPITNLHLNGHPLEASALGLSPAVLDQIQELCQRAMGCYPDLWSGGIDILLERGSLRPRIIEMNGQGDLLYQDIYGDNRIYSHQAEWMRAQAERLRR